MQEDTQAVTPSPDQQAQDPQGLPERLKGRAPFEETQRALRDIDRRHMMKQADHLRQSPHGRIKLAAIQAEAQKERDQAIRDARVAAGETNERKEANRAKRLERIEHQRRDAQATRDRNATQGRSAGASKK